MYEWLHAAAFHFLENESIYKLWRYLTTYIFQYIVTYFANKTERFARLYCVQIRINNVEPVHQHPIKRKLLRQFYESKRLEAYLLIYYR